MRTLVGIAIFSMFLFLLAGCGSSNSSQPAAGTPTASSNPGGSGGSGSGSGGSGGSTSGTPSGSGGSGGSGGTTSGTGGSGSGGTGSGSGSGGSTGGSGSGGTGSGGTGGGGTQQAPTTYIAAILPLVSGFGSGDAEVNPISTGNLPAAGQYALTIAGNPGNSNTYVARFCPFASTTCITLPDQPTFRSSGFQIAGTFPGHGAFSGEFIVSFNGTDTWATGFVAPANSGVAFNGNTFQAQLVRASTLSAGLSAQSQYGVGTDPLTSGASYVSWPDGMYHPTITGAVPLTTYTVSYCDPTGASCVALGTLATDSAGNGSASLSIAPAESSGSIDPGQFKLSRNGANGPVEFVTGFIVP